MRKLAIIVVFFATLAAAPRVFADVYTDATSYPNPATVYFSTYDPVGDQQISVYLNAAGTPIANTTGTVANIATTTLNAYSWSSGGFGGSTDGTYQVTAVMETSCAGQTYADCMSLNPTSFTQAEFTVGSSTPPTPTDESATTTVDQTAQVLGMGFFVWMFAFALAVWITADRRARI